jgi:N-methylhydantoinase B/oxoprolinase/acetone carboxylase alpha subunit
VQIRIHKERLDIINENIRRVEEEIADLEAKIAQNSNDTDLLGEVSGCSPIKCI